MVSVRVPVKQPVLEWAVERTRVPLVELQQKNDFRSLQSWIDGESCPTLRQAKALANMAGIPFGYLLLDEPVNDQPELPDFRTVRSTEVVTASPELENIIHACESRLDWYVDNAPMAGIAPPNFIGRFSAESDITNAVAEARLLLDWSAGTFERGRERILTLSDAIESAGILVMRSSVVGNNNSRKLDVEEFRGFTLIRESFGLIFVNGADAKAGQLFSLAHEFAHILLGSPGISGERNNHRAVERWCNAFAAEFLAPSAELVNAWREVDDLKELARLAYGRYGVSGDVVAWSLVDAGFLSRNRAMAFLDSWRDEIPQRKASGGNFKNTTRSRLGRRFLSALTQALVEDRITETDASRTLGISKVSTIRDLVVEYQGAA